MVARRLVLPAMAGLLAAYVAAHSPALRAIGRVLGTDVQRCYFSCSGWAPNGQPLNALAALSAFALAGAAGWLISMRLSLHGAERFLGFGLLVPAFVTVPASILGAVGWALGATPLRPPGGPLLTAMPAALVLAIGTARGWGWRSRRSVRVRCGALPLILGVTAIGLLGVSAAVALVHPPTAYDALSYHAPLAVYFWRDGNLGLLLDQQIWAWALAHPGTMELWAGLLRLAGGERVANLAQLPFALLGMAAVYVFARHTGLGTRAALIGSLGFLISPIVVLQSGMQLNDLTAGALIMTSAAFSATPLSRWNTSRLAMAGLALGMAAATKLTMLPAVAAIALFLMVRTARTGRGGILLPAAVAFAVTVAPWWARNFALYGNPIYPAAIPVIGRGYVLSAFGTKDAAFVPGAAAWPLYPLLDPYSEASGFGALFAVGVLPGILAAATWGRRAPLALYALLVGLGLPAWWILTSHEPRFVIHVLGLGFAFLGWCLLAVSRARRRVAAWLIGVAAVFSAGVTADQGLRPLARQPTERAEFYDAAWGVDSAAAALPEDEALLSHTGFAPFSYVADYPLLGPHLGRKIVSVDGLLPTDSIVRIMRPRGIRYVYVPAAPQSQQRVAAMYPPDRFDLIHTSVVSDGSRRGTRRYLFKLRGRPEQTSGSGVAP